MKGYLLDQIKDFIEKSGKSGLRPGKSGLRPGAIATVVKIPSLTVCKK